MLQRVAVVPRLRFWPRSLLSRAPAKKAGWVLRSALIFTLAACVFGLLGQRPIWISLPPQRSACLAPSIYSVETSPL